jgi:hypothetical protein
MDRLIDQGVSGSSKGSYPRKSLVELSQIKLSFLARCESKPFNFIFSLFKEKWTAFHPQ